MAKYDKRMNLWDNFVYGIWLPLICRIRGHKNTCYKIVPTNPQEYFTICHRCVKMGDPEFKPCGGCNNGCRG